MTISHILLNASNSCNSRQASLSSQMFKIHTNTVPSDLKVLQSSVKQTNDAKWWKHVGALEMKSLDLKIISDNFKLPCLNSLTVSLFFSMASNPASECKTSYCRNMNIMFILCWAMHFPKL